MKKYILLVFSAALLSACTNDDNELGISTGILPTEIEVVSLSSTVAFETVVAGAATANIHLVDTSGIILPLRTAVPVNDKILAAEFTIAELKLSEVDDEATLKIEVPGGGYTFSTISMVSAWNTPVANKKFTTLEASMLSDTLTFSVNIEEWMDESKIAITATRAINSGAALPLALASVEDEEGADVPSAKQYVFIIATLQSTTGAQAGDTVNISLTATYDGGRSEDFEYAFVITADEFAETAGNEFAAFLTNGNIATFTAADSAQTFYGLLSGEAYKGVENALAATKNEPVIFFASSDYKLYTLPSDSCQVGFEPASEVDFDANNRLAVESAPATFSSIPEFNWIGTNYYVVKVEIGVKPTTYYGYLAIEPVMIQSPIYGEDVYSAKYTVNYGLERDYEEE
ncbi:hypothetical protein AGMMS49982_16040 [Bacteroidia bacterium]|nr:hypothetical protein AGMMS49982_16040 [Bacteroidia bacterium]